MNITLDSSRPSIGRGLWLCASLACLLTAGGCSLDDEQSSVPLSMSLTSSSAASGALDAAAGCHGAGSSPQLAWSAPPAGTRSVAITMTDRTSAWRHHFVHWVIYDIPPDIRQLPVDLPTSGALPDGSRQGISGTGNSGYAGPCPPPNSVHRYALDLYAIDSRIDLTGASKKDLMKAIAGHVLARGRLMVTYGP